MPQTHAVILAAGLGTRMKSKKHKVLHPLGGKPMVEHIVRTLEALGVGDIIVVVGRGANEVKGLLGDRVRYAFQEEQLGTAHALKQAKPLLAGQSGTTIVINGDNPLITEDTYRAFVGYFEQRRVAASVLTAVWDDPTGYGRIIRTREGDVERIVEEKDTTATEREVREISTGTFCFDNEKLFPSLEKVTNDNAQGEYYLPDVLDILRNEGERIAAYCVEDASETIGINNRVQLAEAEQILRQRILKRHMLAGVTIVDPTTTYIEGDVAIGRDTIIYPGTHLGGETVIGEDCIIGPNADIRDCTLADGVTVLYSTLRESEVMEKATVGPYAYVRPNSKIGPEVKIGDFVEVKNSVIGKKTKVSHLAYIGDSEIGQQVNVSCGAITVNYDGENKWRTVVGDRSFIGCNVNLVAPVNIGRDAFIAAGSTVTDDVGENGFAIARERQTTKEQYVPKLKEKIRVRAKRRDS